MFEISPDGTQGETQGETQGDNMTPDEEIENNRKRKRTSKVWVHFTIQTINGVEKAVCNHCANKFVGGSSMGTSHLTNHLKRCPKYKRGQTDIRNSMGQKGLVGKMVNGVTSLDVMSFDQQESRNKLAKMVILHEFPLSIVDYVGFREYSFSLQPSFKMISRNTLKSDIYKIYEYERSNVVKLLAKCKGRVSIITDMWTSSNKKRGFMVITAHFIDETWTLQSIILRFIYVPSPHTSAVLQEVLLESMLEWDLDRRLGCLTVDNRTTNDAMVRLLLDKLQSSCLLLRGEFFHMRCAAHIINLIVQDGLKVIEKCIEKVRDSVIFWTASPKRRKKFRETVDQIPISCTKELVLDCKTRWNSTFFMLSSALIYKDAFFRLRQREKDYTSLPSEDEWDMALKICDKLSLFYNATNVFSGTSYPTANVYFSKICHIKIEMTEWLSSRDIVISNMASFMLNKFEDYWSDTNGIMAVASMLDPRLKKTFLDFMFRKIYGADVDYQIKRVTNICLDLMRQYSAKSVASTLTYISDRPHTSSSKSLDALAEYDLFVNSQSQKVEDVEVELKHYLEDGVLPRTSDLDVLSWWKNHGVKYPTLRMIARDILAIPVSTVASESAFSTSGRILSPHRSRLNAKTAEALMCAQSWLWSEIRGKTTSPSDDIQTILDDNEEDDEVDLES